MRVLLLGLGSIAQKHIQALKLLRPDSTIYALRSSNNSNEIDGVVSLYQWQEIPVDIDFVIISNPTSKHFETIKKAVSLKVPLFIEKPPFMNMEGVEDLIKTIEECKIPTYTAFNFTFHPALVWVKNNLLSHKIVEVQAYCGSYLPSWRKNVDYRNVYSAHEALGGGVHLDLIHELHYIYWLFGAPKKSTSFKRKTSSLEINSMDTAHYWWEYDSHNVSVLLNYYRKDSKRTLEIVTEEDTYLIDLIKNCIVNSNGDVLYKSDFNVLDTYVEQMKYFLDSLNKKESLINNLRYATEVLKLCL